MSLTIEQEASYVGNGRWKWAVWIEGPETQLDRVDSVAWQLHPTFPEPLRWAENRTDKFRLETNGWGAFEIRATLYDPDGRPAGPLRHMLRLERPGQDAAPMRAPAKTARKVFISASLGDAEISRLLRNSLEAVGVEVWDAAADLEPGDDWPKAIAQAISRADAVVAVVRDGALSPSVENDVGQAQSLAKILIPIVVGDEAIPAPLARYKALRIKDAGEVTDIAASIAKQLD